MNYDWKTVPVDKYANQLESADPNEQEAGVRGVCSLVLLGNEKAFKLLLNYFKELPPPKTIEGVHYKIGILEELEYASQRSQIIPCLIE